MGISLVAAGIGLLFFLAAIVFLLTNKIQPIATISLISGALVEVISGVNFYFH
ncbi:MAG: hypothetical protein HQK72_11750 [Desulfamplus sp.]|nr:hypothetical protein [Desulfamplus sp.]